MSHSPPAKPETPEIPSNIESGSTAPSLNSRASIRTPTEEDVYTQPWRYIGYRGYSEFLSSDDDFFVLRRFGALNARIALSLQDKVSALEEELTQLDQEYTRSDSSPINNGTFREDTEDRAELLDQIAVNLREYSKYLTFFLATTLILGLDDFLIQQTRLRSYAQAPQRDVESIRNWHYNHGYCVINKEEQRYLDKEKDLVCVVQKDIKTPLRRLIDSSLWIRTLPIWRDKTERLAKMDAGYASYYSDKRMGTVASAMIACIGAGMLVTPIWILQALNDLTMKLVVITVFLLASILVLSFVMVAKPFEALGVSAA